MNIVENADLMPGSCYITGANDGPFIDTGYDIDDRPNIGRVYIAASTVSDMAGMLGGLAAADAQRLRDGIAARDARIHELEEAVKGLTSANEALVVAGYAPVKFDPVDDLLEKLHTAIDELPALEDLPDDDLIELVLDAGLELPSNASRDDMIAALHTAEVNQ